MALVINIHNSSEPCKLECILYVLSTFNDLFKQQGDMVKPNYNSVDLAEVELADDEPVVSISYMHVC